MSNIRLKCVNQSLSFLNTPVISSGNVNYDTVTIDFCSSWTGFTKTAIFYRNKDDVYYQLLDENNSCIIPREVLREKGTVYIGVFGVAGDVTLTSEVLGYRVHEGAITEDLKPSDPTPDIYEQLLSTYNNHITRLDSMESTIAEMIEKGFGDASTLGGNAPEYFATADSVKDIIDGTTKVGDADKLDGYDSTEFAKVDTLTSYGIGDDSLANNEIGYDYDFQTLCNKSVVTFFTNWHDSTNFPALYGSGILLPAPDPLFKRLIYFANGLTYFGYANKANDTWNISWENYLPTTGGTLTENVKTVTDTTAERHFKVANELHDGHLCVSGSGNLGIYSSTLAKWLIMMDVNGVVKLNGVDSSRFADETGIYNFVNKGLNTINIDEEYRYNYVVAISEQGYGTRPHEAWTNVVNFFNNHFVAQIAFSCTAGTADRTPKMWIREKYQSEDHTWSSWRSFPVITSGTEDLTAGTSALSSGNIHIVYE